MANKGLKEYTKQISQTIGDVAKVAVNVNKTDANMHIIIPLIQTLGPNPMEVSVLFNYQDMNQNRSFGKGCFLSTFKNIVEPSSTIEVIEADGSRISYALDSNNTYISKESPLKVKKDSIYISGDGDYDIYSIEDLQGNVLYFDENYTFYPNTIQYKNGFRVSLDGPNMDNHQGAKITFTNTGNSMYSRATYTQDGTTLYYVDFSYDSNQRLTNVEHYKESKLVKHLSIVYGTNVITIKDEISKDYASYTFVSGRVETIKEYINGRAESLIATSISYEDGKTTITDNDGRKGYIFFDEENFPLFEMDEDGNAIETEHDLTTKKLTSKSSNIPTKNKFENLCSLTIENFSETSGISTTLVSVSDAVLSGVLGTVYKVSGTGSLRYTLSTAGLGSDNITAVIWGRQKTAYTNSSKVRVTLTVDGTDSDEFKKTIIDNNFDMMTLGVSAIKSYSSITLTITLIGNAEIEIGGIQLLKKDFGSFYQYDENGNVTGSESGKGSTSNVYNSKGLPTRSIGKESAMYDFEYDTKGNMTSAKTAFGGKIENTYDSYNNVTKNVVSNAGGTKKLETTKTYENGRFVSSETDELGNKTSFTYDSFGKIKKVTDALNATTEYSYDAFDNLTKILFNNSVSVNYTYDSQNKLKTATLPNGNIYSFGYDESNNLNSVSMNGTQIVTFEYDPKTGLIKKQTYGTSGDAFEFIYNTKHNIKQIKINGSLRYQYLYDNYDRLEEVWDETGIPIKIYEYDNDGQLIKAVENGSTIEYSYDSLGEVNQKKRTLNSKVIYESFDSVSRSKGFSPDNIIGYLQGNSDFLGTIFNGDSDIKNPSYICKPYNYKTNGESKLPFIRKGVIPCVYCGTSNPISYNPPMANRYIEDCGCLGFWFYPAVIPASGKKKYLFNLKHRSLSSSIAVYLNSSGNLVLEVRDTSNNVEIKELNSYVVANNWHFFGLNFMYRDDGEGYMKVFSYELYHNSDCLKGTITNKPILTGSVTPYHIGYRFDGTNGYDELGCYITGLMIGCRTQLTTQQMQEYYSLSKDYIIGSSYLDGNSVDFSATSVHNLSEAMLNQFEIYPLQNSVKSLKGTNPIAYDVRKVSSTDKNRSFNYNNKIKRYAYVADEGRLEYALNISTDGTILMRAFISETAEKQYFFELKDSGGRKLGLYRGNDGYLYIHNVSSHIKTTLSFSTETWHTVGISFKSATVSDSMSTLNYETVRVYLDGQTYSTDILYASFKTFTLSVGKLFDSVKVTDQYMGDYYTYYPMLGQIEMLATKPAFCEVATLNTLANELKDTTKVSEYDELGMLQKVVLRKGDSDILTNTMNYKKRSASSIFISRFIEKEVIKYGSTTVNRSYGIDSLGNVTSVTDSIFGSHTYTYNDRGFLTKEDSTEYAYDSNGNITKAGDTTFTYDATIKDRLKYVNGNMIDYITNKNALNPSHWKDIYYSWEGRRLLGLSERGEISHSYTYDDNGLRISKKITNGRTQESSLTKYYYDGDLLITEVNPSYRLDFLYDENDSLYGFIYNNSEKYYYIRDFMQNILGIIDSSGNLVVKYEYTAYGTIQSTTGSKASTIGAYNPFRYKGYYYDSETKMYYCKSRYYNPEWCRWLNGDNINYLRIQSVNDMNLFSYCKNNPIILSDSFGTNWWDDFCKGVSNCWNTVCDWASNTFGSCVKIVDTNAQPPIENLFGGIAQGTQTTNYLLGDNSKPVTFFAENASAWWKFWEYKIGVSINIGRFSYTASTGIGNQSASFSWENKSIEFFSEVNKVGIGTSYTSGNTSHYTQYYVKPINVAFAFAIAYLTGGILALA